MRTIEINSLDLGYTIDTYGMFTGESTDESESDHYREEYNLTDDEWRTIGFDYDHPEIVKALANSSVQLLDENLVQHGSGVVMAIDLRSTTSPRFYNYTTDSYRADWTIDESKLIDYINQDTAKFANHLVESWNEFIGVPVKIDLEWLTDDDDKMLVAAIDFWSRNEYDPESYDMQMFEVESEAYYENMTLNTESQQLIDSKSKESK